MSDHIDCQSETAFQPVEKEKEPRGDGSCVCVCVCKQRVETVNRGGPHITVNSDDHRSVAVLDAHANVFVFEMIRVA